MRDDPAKTKSSLCLMSVTAIASRLQRLAVHIKGFTGGGGGTAGVAVAAIIWQCSGESGGDYDSSSTVKTASVKTDSQWAARHAQHRP